MGDDWYRISNEAEIPSPALLVYPNRIVHNLQRMVEIAGMPARLRPHVKTHKLPELIGMQLSLGIDKFKCATIAEAEMVAGSGGMDILLAHQPVGPNAARLRFLMDRYPKVRWAAIVDDANWVNTLSRLFSDAPRKLSVYLDLDCGMHRTGIAPGPEALNLYRTISQSPGLEAGGLHAYDGHNHEPDLAKRTAQCEADFVPVLEFREQLEGQGLSVPELVAGGTPTFPVHAAYADRNCSPGTTTLWDFGYGDGLLDLEFDYAAILLTRVISRPGTQRACFDLGHKAVAADKPLPRVRFFGHENAEALVHSEEQLMLEGASMEGLQVGDCCYGVPAHICPTVALHDHAWVVQEGKAVGLWDIAARRRSLGV